ncbi:RHS repeat-associated core domain-containing protein [Streptomyces sp. NPDC000878]
MTLKQRHKQVDEQRFKAPASTAEPKWKSTAEAVAEAEKTASRARSDAALADPKDASASALASFWGIPQYTRVVGSEGGLRASTESRGAFNGQVVLGENVSATTLVQNSDQAFDSSNDPIDVLHTVKVTWIVQCQGVQKEYDLNQVGITHSAAYAAYNQTDDPIFSFTAAVDPEQCAQGLKNPFSPSFQIMAQAEVTDPGGGAGLTSAGAYLVESLSDDQTLGCETDCGGAVTGFPQPQAYRGSGVNTATGGFSHQYTDVSEFAPGGGLDLTRRYAQVNGSSGSLTAEAQPVGSAGPNWLLPWDAHLTVAANGSVTFVSDSGSRVTYVKNGSSYTAPVTSRATLSQLPDGSYTLTTRLRQTLAFAADGTLRSSKNVSGQGVTYQYTGANVTSITDSTGRVTTLKYSNGVLSQAVLADGRDVDYFYTSGRLSSVSGTDQTSVSYAYTANGQLDFAKDQNGNYPFRNTYDSQGRVESQQDAEGRVTSFTYSGTETDTTAPDGGIWTDIHIGNILAAQYDPFGNKTFYTYDGQVNLNHVIDPLNNTTAYAYDNSGRLTSIVDGEGDTERFAYDSSGNFSKYTDGNNRATNYTYDAKGYLSTAVDAPGNATTFTYTATGQIATQTDPLQNKTTYGYDAAGNQTSVKSPSGAITTQSFDASGRVTSSTDARGNVPGADSAAFTTTYTYDAANRLLTTTDPKGRTTKHGYDAVGNQTSLTDPAGKTTSYAYDGANRAISVTDPAGNTTQQSYDTMGRRLSATDATGGKTTYTYDKAGRTLSMTTPRGNAAGANAAQYTWRYGYDLAGNPTTVTDPLGNTTATAYTADHQPASVTDPLGNVRKYTYDGTGNVLRTTDALSRTTINTYNANSQLATVKDRAGNTVTYAYDTAGRLATETSPLGNKVTYAYDADGRLTSVVEPRGNVAGADPAQYTGRTSYDPAGNAISQTDPLGNSTTSSYDTVGNLVETTDARGKKTAYSYDALDRLTTVTAPDGGTTTLGYDVVGNMTSRVDANQQTTSYAYDKTGRPTRVTDALNRSTSYTYDADGNPATVTNARGQTATGDFDARGLPSKVTYSDGTPSVSYTYDAAGRITTLADGTGTRNLTYDAENRPLTITSPGATNPFRYTYNHDGTVSTRTYPDNYAISYAYDADGRITSQTTSGKTTTYGWDVAGNLLSTQFPTTTALTENRTYDRAGRLASITEGTGARQLTRDPDGRLVAEQYTDVTTTGLASRYGYDSTGRLTRTCTDTVSTTSCLDGTAGATYAYDKTGNLATSVTGSTSITNTYDSANQLTKRVVGSTTTNLTYDADGNLTKDATGTYAYDALSRVKSATIGANSYTFVHDADGNRTLTNKNGTLDRTTRWDLNNPLAQIATDTDGTGAKIADYNYNPAGIPQAVNRTAGVYYLLHDRQDSIRSVHDATGAATYTYTYTPWGEATGTPATTGGQSSPFGFTGQYIDPYLTGRLALRARSYDPAVGRFTTTDPVPAETDSTNPSPYAYAGNDPVNQADPSGRCALLCSVGIGAAFGAVIEGGMYAWEHRDGGFTWTGLAKAGGKGALTGAIAGALMPGTGNLAARGLGLSGGRALATSAAVNAGVGAGYSWAVNEVQCRPTGPWDLLIGAAGGGSTSLVGPAFTWLKGRLPIGESPRTFPNHYGSNTESLAKELADAITAGVSPISAGSAAFNKAVRDGGDYLWAVGSNGKLRILFNASDKIKHSVMFRGAPVQGAGDVTFAGGRVTRITDQSGHYFPWLEDDVPSFLQSGVDAFRKAGVTVPEDAIEKFGW